MPHSKKHKNKPKLTRKKAIIISISLILLLAIGWFTNLIPFAYMTVKCGGFPVEIIAVKSSMYTLPEDRDYGTIPIAVKYPYCTAEEAENAGYTRTIFRDKDTDSENYPPRKAR